MGDVMPAAPSGPGARLLSRTKSIWTSRWQIRRRSEFSPSGISESHHDDLVEYIVKLEQDVEWARYERDRMIEAYLDEKELRQHHHSDFISLVSEEVMDRYLSRTPEEYPTYDKE